MLTSLSEVQYLPEQCDQQNTQLNMSSEILPRKGLYWGGWEAFKPNGQKVGLGGLGRRRRLRACAALAELPGDLHFPLSALSMKGSQSIPVPTSWIPLLSLLAPLWWHFGAGHGSLCLALAAAASPGSALTLLRTEPQGRQGSGKAPSALPLLLLILSWDSGPCPSPGAT